MYQPGRWACPNRHGRAHHGGPEFEPAEEDDSDEVSSDGEEMHEQQLLDEDDADSQDTLPEVPTPRLQTTSRKRTLSIDDESVDTGPAASHLEHKAKRRCLEGTEDLQHLLRNLRDVNTQLEAGKAEMRDLDSQIVFQQTKVTELKSFVDEEVLGEARFNADVRGNYNGR